MTQPRTSDAVSARLALADRYDREAKAVEDMIANVDPKASPTVHSNLTNIAQRKRTYAATARRMAGTQPQADVRANEGVQ
jgi:hypothetical protein